VGEGDAQAEGQRAAHHDARCSPHDLGHTDDDVDRQCEEEWGMRYVVRVNVRCIDTCWVLLNGISSAPKSERYGARPAHSTKLTRGQKRIPCVHLRAKSWSNKSSTTYVRLIKCTRENREQDRQSTQLACDDTLKGWTRDCLRMYMQEPTYV